jgi:hypothetical protein
MTVELMNEMRAELAEIREQEMAEHHATLETADPWATDACPACDGSGWTCANCGETGVRCTCDPEHEQDAHDCQECEGSGVAEND